MSNQEAKDVKAYFRRYRVSETPDPRQDDDEDEGNDSQDGEEESIEDFLEPEEDNAVDNGALYVRSRSIPLIERTMIIKGRGKGKEIKVKGKFIMDGPWWNVSFKAVETGDVYICQGTPTYALREENGEKGKTLLNLLLSYVFSFPKPESAENQMRESFWKYLEEHRNRNVTRPMRYTFKLFFTALEKALREKVTPGNDNAILLLQAAKQIMRRFDPLRECFRGGDGGDEDKKKTPPKFDLRYVYRCFKCPLLFKMLPLLQEREALSSLSTGKLSDLECLESVLKKSPADLGFYTSMRQHNWGTMEVPFEGFVKAGMIPPNLFKCTAKEDPTAATSSGPKRKGNSTPQVSVMMAKALKLYDIVKSRCREGKHTILYESNVRAGWCKDACKGYHFGNIREEAFVELQNRNVVEIETEASQSQAKFHWSRYRRYEESIARSLGLLICRHSTDPWTLPLGDFCKYNLDPYQLSAAQQICQHALTIILGGGGCGKTHVVASFIREFLAYKDEERKRKMQLMKELIQVLGDDEFSEEKGGNKEKEGNEEDKKEEKDKKEEEEEESKKVIKQKEQPSVLLTAPTGRAASILKRRIGMEGLEAKTLHSVLGSTRKCDSEKFIYSEVEILVVDECSLVPISVLSEILRTLLCYKLKKVIFLGDPYQLPSIDPGNFLQDIIKVFQTTNHNVIQTLKINHRTDEGGRLIVENAKRIAEEKRSDLICQRDRFQVIDLSDCEAGSGQEQVVDKLRKLLNKDKHQLQDHKNSQAVAFRNVDVKNINRVCCRYYAAHSPFKNGKPDYHIGDKICARKNSTIRTLWRSKQKNKEERKEEAGGTRGPEEGPGEEEAGPSNRGETRAVETERISNGDTFFIENWSEVVENDGKKRTVVTLQSMDEEEGTLFKVDFKEMKRKCKIEYAWARTINTYQGSETDYIVYVISPNSYYETWQHLYTAITRGRKGCFILCTPESLKRVVGTNPRSRQTSLARFLAENWNFLPPQVSRPSLLGHANPGTPERPIPRDASSCSRATASSPCSWTPRQEQPVRGSPLLQPPCSNSTTPLGNRHQGTPLGRQVMPASAPFTCMSSSTPVQSKYPGTPLGRRQVNVSNGTPTASSTSAALVHRPYQRTPSRGQEVNVIRSTPSGPCTSSATPVQSLTRASVASSCGISTSTATPVQSIAGLHEMATLLNVAKLATPARAVAVPECTSSLVGSSRCQSSAGGLHQSTSSVIGLPGCKSPTANHPRGRSSAVDPPTCSTSAVGSTGCQATAVSLPQGASSAVASPGRKPATGDTSGWQSSAVHNPGSAVGDHSNSKQEQGDFPSEVKVKVNRSKLSRKRNIKSNSVPGNKDAPCPQKDEGPDPVDTEVAKKKLCVENSSSPESTMLIKECEHPDIHQAVREREQLDRDRAVNEGTEQTRGTSLLAQPKGESFFTAIQPQKRKSPPTSSGAATSCSTVGYSVKSGFKFSRKHLNPPPNTDSTDSHHLPERTKMERPTSAREGSQTTACVNAAETHSSLASSSSDEMNVEMLPKEVQSSDDFRSPLPGLASRSDPVMNPVIATDMSTSFKIERPSADGGDSCTQGHFNGKESHSKLSRASRGKKKMQISPKEVKSSSDFRSPAPCLASRSTAATESVSTKSPHGKSDAFLPKKSQSPHRPKDKKGRKNASRSQAKQQSQGSSPETVIYVPGLRRGRYRHTRRLLSQESDEEPSAASRKSSECIEDCPFEDSNDQEQSQFLLQPPPVMHNMEDCPVEDSSDQEQSQFLLQPPSVMHNDPHQRCPDQSQRDDNDDDGDKDNDRDVFRDDSEDEEMSQFLFQLPDEDCIS